MTATLMRFIEQACACRRVVTRCYAHTVKTILLVFTFSVLILETSGAEPRRLEAVDGVVTRGEIIDTDPKANTALAVLLQWN
jgi:hypothetical protein